jgi:hypothetical protein
MSKIVFVNIGSKYRLYKCLLSLTVPFFFREHF